MKKIVALVPARSGSVRVKHKNLKQIHGVPLVGLAVRQALMVPEIDEVFISTDSPKYAQIAENYGAKAPFLRPAALSGSEATDYDVFLHFLDWYEHTHHEMPLLIVQVRATAPVREPETLRQAIAFLLEHPEFDSLRSVSAPHQSPYKMWYMDQTRALRPVIRTGETESYDMPTQSLPCTYAQDGIVDVVRPETLRQYCSMAGQKLAGLLDHPKTWDIDTDLDFQTASRLVDSSYIFRLLNKKRAFGANLGIIQGRLSPSDTLQRFPDETWREEFDKARSCGYTCIEWIRDKSRNPNNPIWSSSFHAEEIINVSFLSGVGVRSICDDFVQACDWETLTVDQYVLLETLIMRASELGVKTIVYPLFESADINSAGKYAAFKRHISSLAAVARRFQICIALELTCGAERMREIMDEVDLPNVGLCVDTGNLYAAGVAPEEIIRCEALSKSILHIHLKDRDSDGRNVVPGEGMVDFPAVFQALLSSQYSGLIITETDRGANPIETAVFNKRLFSDLLKM